MYHFYSASKKEPHSRVAVRFLWFKGFAYSCSALFSHGWFATPQEVLQADWQEVWHSPQPPFSVLILRVSIVTILFISVLLLQIINQ